MPTAAATPHLRLLLAGAEARSRMHLRRLLGNNPEVEVVGHIRPGASVEEAVQRTGADVLVADATDDRATAQAAAQIALRLRLRVLLLTPEGTRPASPDPSRMVSLARPASLDDELPDSAFATALRARLMSLAGGASRATPGPRVAARPLIPSRPVLIAIGSSTGGPQALPEVLRRLAGRVKQPVVITQHMPATFTPILADHLTRHTGMTTAEAVEGLALRPGHAYLAPGGRHLLLQRQGEQITCHLDDGPPENFCRPAVDPMLRSVVAVVGGKAMAVILTGMGHDGLAGCQALIAAGGAVLAQDEATSVVWGMPGAVAQAGLCQAVLPLSRIGDEIVTMAGAGI
jgi:two-component system chemotaxis response regulator CheB